jgi:hypothetical protein
MAIKTHPISGMDYNYTVDADYITFGTTLNTLVANNNKSFKFVGATAPTSGMVAGDGWLNTANGTYNQYLTGAWTQIIAIGNVYVGYGDYTGKLYLHSNGTFIEFIASSGGWVGSYKGFIPSWQVGVNSRTSIKIGSYSYSTDTVKTKNFKIPVNIIFTVFQGPPSTQFAIFVLSGTIILSTKSLNPSDNPILSLPNINWNTAISAGGYYSIGSVSPVYNAEIVLQNKTNSGGFYSGDIVILSGGNSSSGTWNTYIDADWGITPKEVTMITN